MPNKNYVRGRRKEYKSMKVLEERGYTVARTAGSHGLFDVIAISPDRVLLVQVKADRLSPEEKAAIAALKTPSNVLKILHVWKDREELIESQLL